MGRPACSTTESWENASGRLEESYYLIPSSVHEVILIPASAVGDSRELCALVQEMNRTQVRSTEVLSDTVYLYSEETRRLEMIDF